MVAYNIKAWGFRDQILKEIAERFDPDTTLSPPEQAALYLAEGWHQIATSLSDRYVIARHLDNMPRLINEAPDGLFLVTVTDDDQPVIISFDPFSVEFNVFIRNEEEQL